MKDIEKLTNKVQEAAKQLKNLKKEREQLLGETQLLQEENYQAKKILRRNEALKAEKTRIKDRLERLLNKLSDLNI